MNKIYNGCKDVADYIATGYLMGRDEGYTGEQCPPVRLAEFYDIVSRSNYTFSDLKDICDAVADNCDKKYEDSSSYDNEDNCDCDDCNNESDNKFVTLDEFDLGCLQEIEKVIFSGKATIVFWEDGSKTVVKCQKGDVYSKEEGLAMAICKRAYGNDNLFNDIINEAMDKSITVEGKRSDAKTTNSKKSK